MQLKLFANLICTLGEVQSSLARSYTASEERYLCGDRSVTVAAIVVVVVVVILQYSPAMNSNSLG